MNPGKANATHTLAGHKTIHVSDDTSLSVRANIVLQTTQGVSLIEGAASTTQGVVTLRGRVRTAAQRAKAGLAVAAIDGVQGVRNLLDVVAEASEGTPREAEPTDEVIKKKLEAALNAERDRKLLGLKVTDVNNGVIHMSGKGVTLTGRLRAIELAWNAAEAADESPSVGNEASSAKTHN